VDANFQGHFVQAMGIPHSSHPYPMLSKAVQLPETPAATAGSRGRRRRSRQRP
jgi:uncharacterized 2Fe-2S/4Fe-4S cluster protein (DUF4445 family)